MVTMKNTVCRVVTPLATFRSNAFSQTDGKILTLINLIRNLNPQVGYQPPTFAVQYFRNLIYICTEIHSTHFER
jgi:hypothetical protein